MMYKKILSLHSTFNTQWSTFSRLLSLLFLHCSLLIIFSSCSDKDYKDISLEEVEVFPKVNVDSIFTDLGKSVIDKKAASIDKVFSNLRRRTGFNGTVLYAEQGRIVYEKAWGYRNVRNRKDELHVDDKFQLSSVSKMFTAEAIMILRSQGKIDYDVDIREYIPEFPYEGITTRLLLNHRSGLSRYESLADAKWPDRRQPFFNDDMIEYYVKYVPTPYFKPNKGFNYSNVNYALLASIVERVSGVSFADFMKENVFDPVGMSNSYIYEMQRDTTVSMYIEGIVQGYYLGRHRPMQAQNEYLNGVKGDKIMISNTKDMFRFWTAVDYGLYVPDSIQDEAFKPGSPKSRKRKDNYGFGWRIPSKYPGCYYHYGWWKGYRSFFLRDDVNDKTLIILTNTDKGPGSDHFWKIINDKTNKIAPASVNIPYWEITEGLRFPHSSYRYRNDR